jgi:hypothetical protein
MTSSATIFPHSAFGLPRDHFRFTVLDSVSPLLVLPWLIALVGCGDGKASVNGTVTFDGQPVASGAVAFVKEEAGQIIREGAIIKDGSFEAHLPPGKYKVELNAQKVVGKRKQKGFDGKDEDVELTEELFPARYNAQSVLSEDIKSGVNTLKLDIKSGP